jgi:2',3'-cyclic-nucleotide 2'-phosphodiesterase (5'-nucleotidase family)
VQIGIKSIIMLNRILSGIVCICFCSVWLTSCGSPAEPKETEIIIISLNDVHGNFENLAKISAFIQKTRTKHEHVIVADAGDRFTGNPYNDFFERTQAPLIDLMNTMGLDITVIGNHEFDYGAELLRDRLQMAEFIEVLANIETQNTIFNKLITPYHVFNMGGVEVGFLGLVCIDRQTGKPPALLDHVKEFTFFDPIETAINHRNSLRHKPDVYIALTHIGIENDYLLADSVPELDLIIGGHSHYLTVEPEFYNNVKILATDLHGDHIFKTTIIMKGQQIKSLSTELIATAALTDEDPIMVKKIQQYENNAFLSEPLFTLRHPFNEVQLGFLIADAALTLPGTDFTILNCGSVRTDTLRSGPISYANLLRVYPFSNHYGIIALRPAEMREIIEWEFETRKRCDAYPGGFHYVIDLTQDSPQVVKMTYPNGKALDENKSYNVVLNSFLISRHFSKRRDEVRVLPIFVVDNILNYLKRNPNADYRRAPRRVTRLEPQPPLS